jgi:hypothetical protein
MLRASRKEKNNLAYIILFVQLFILYGWRDYSVVADTIAYSTHFKNIRLEEPFYQIKFNEDRFGAGYLIFEKFIHNVITNNALHYQIITSFITLFATFLFFRKYSNYAWLTLFLFFALRLCQDELIALRQTLALVCGFSAYYFLQQKKNILYFLFILIAITFHNTAWFLFVFFFLEHIKLKKMFIFTILGLIVIFVFYGFILNNYFDKEDIHYTESIEKNMFTIFGVFNTVCALILFLIILFLNKKSLFIGKLDQKKNTFLALLYVAIMIMSIRTWVFARFSIYLLPFIIVYISNLVYYIPNKLMKHFAIFILVFYSITTFLFLFSIRPEWIGMIPYKFYGQ